MLKLTFEASDRESLETAIREYAGLNDRGDPSPVVESSSAANPKLKHAGEMSAVLARIRSAASRDHLIEVAEGTVAGSVVPFESETRKRHGKRDARAWGGAISGVNRAFHDAVDPARDLIRWDGARKGYTMRPEYARAVLDIVSRQNT